MKGIREMAIDSEKPEKEPQTYHKTYNSDGNETTQECLPFSDRSYGKYSKYGKDQYGGAFNHNDYDPYSSFNSKKSKAQKDKAITIELTVTYEEIGTTDELTMINAGKEYDQLQEKAEDAALEKLYLFAKNDLTEKYTIACNADDNYITGFDVILTCTPIE